MSDDALMRELEQDYTAARADAAERVKIQASLADRTLQAVTFANGGAIVALFTFAGNVVAKGSAIALNMRGLRYAFLWFALGLAAALLAHISGFISQDRFYNTSMAEAWRMQRSQIAGAREPVSEVEKRFLKQGAIAYFAGLGFVTMSIALFATGAAVALWAVS